jgi:hypothetical protein
LLCNLLVINWFIYYTYFTVTWTLSALVEYVFWVKRSKDIDRERERDFCNYYRLRQETRMT